MTFTKYYGKDVAGLVFVDASHPDQISRMSDTYSAPNKNWRQNISSMTAASQVTFGMARFHHSPVRGLYNLASTDVFAINAYAPVSMLAATEEGDALVETLAEARTAGLDINEGEVGVEVRLHHAVERGFFGTVRTLQSIFYRNM